MLSLQQIKNVLQNIYCTRHFLLRCENLRTTATTAAANSFKNKYVIFFSGANARMIYFITSAAVTWTTYEGAKKYLGFNLDDLDL